MGLKQKEAFYVPEWGRSLFKIMRYLKKNVCFFHVNVAECYSKWKSYNVFKICLKYVFDIFSSHISYSFNLIRLKMKPKIDKNL